MVPPDVLEKGSVTTPLSRERIATAILQGLLASDAGLGTPSDAARTAVEIADALIAELDATQPPPARDPDVLGSAGIYQELRAAEQRAAEAERGLADLRGRVEAVADEMRAYRAAKFDRGANRL